MHNLTEQQFQDNYLYLTTLSKQYPSIRAVASEIINLEAIMNLPKNDSLGQY